MANLKNVRPLKIMMELGDKQREIKFDLNAFAELEKRFGTVEKAMEKMQSGGMSAIKTVLWVGLIHEEAVLDEDTGEPIKYNITPFQVGSWITMQNLEEVSRNLTRAMGADLPDPKVEDIQKELKNIAITGNVDSDIQVAKVELTEEEKAAEAKNA